ncbi:ABC transporter permease [Saccharolobus solfataricus]|uniref:Oligo/dipeptide transport, permease protein (DppC-1) n=3 Tax=Saccharolobus solfataricus TaxID=2287 RepID=Q97YP9_SACS2|nr:ABC transporter permease [Saccharolobus solfataricus]AAK41512.1 Oligo/dipeptide transport, permease protein (dppC-1) [Saccharolobus solfataricus P2]AKA74438.1 ABC transporter permease [Saccharolobus solfataricus]AKA77133.1 ABC transporter permease [Saccharolobus solfataricus]AKA79826.1 ABC transporter permease [Saccharolobus solfataricus]AZF68917.1 ABC transporter permease [Saccharolobus solfataricus]
MSKRNVGFSSYIRDFLSSKIGLVGLIILIILLIFTGIALSIPAKVYVSWNNPAAWNQYPEHVPPAWLSIFYPGKYFTTEELSPINMSLYSPAKNIFVAIITYQFNWSKVLPAYNVYFITSSNVTPIEEVIYWSKPDGYTLQVNVPAGVFNVPFDLTSIRGDILSYISSITGKTPNIVNSTVLSSALFNSPKSNFTVIEQGKYVVKIEIVSSLPMNITKSRLILLGNSYGLMGTDYFGRPLDLGILLGLPNALEIGVLTSLVAVLVGVFVGGISGYLGGNKDSIIQWVTLVFLALPALPFLVAVSFVAEPNIVIEALLIAFLSWPFYAIIARSMALSIKSNSYVEADKLLGIPSYRVFFTHFMPRLIPITVAYMVLGVPAGILLAQTLAFLGIAPANIVTWGGILDAAETYQAQVNGWWWWVVFPGAMVVIVAIPFVLIGFAIERVTLGER